jgi:hypothetical protein
VIDHWDTAEADFQHFYALDLREACYGPSPTGSRRLMALLRGLPQESGLGRVLYPQSDWGYSEELLATLAELVDYGNRIAYAAAPFKRKETLKPIQIPRPHQQKTEKPKASHDEILRFFGGN